MTTQTEMFPKTTVEVLDELLFIHRDQYEKAVTALDNLSDDEKIAKAYQKAEDKVVAARQLVHDLRDAVDRERRVDGTASPEAAARNMKRVASQGDDRFVILDVEAEAPDIDPITGEVESKTSTVVIALYPGDDEPHVTEIGEFTRYSELVADYFTAAGLHGDVDADEWQVLAENELATNGGGGRNLYAVIQERDYGHRLLVAAADQGSVCGVGPDYEAAKDAAESAA